MARVKRSIIELRGKVGNQVFTGGKTPHVRKSVAPGSKKNEPALKKQYERAAYLNKLAGDINSIVSATCGQFKPGQFYQKMLRRFRKESSNNRFLLLRHLKDLEINPINRFNKLGYCETVLNRTKDNIVVTLTAKFHPHRGEYKADCYYYDALLLTWTAKSKTAKVHRQITDWIRLTDKLPEFDFKFTCPTATVHWLLCLRQRLGLMREIESRREIESNEAEGMVIREAGSFDKKDLELLEEQRLEARKRSIDPKIPVNIVRVKPKG